MSRQLLLVLLFALVAGALAATDYAKYNARSGIMRNELRELIRLSSRPCLGAFFGLVVVDVCVGSCGRRKGKEFRDENAKKPGVVVLPSGLQYEVSSVVV